jgi:hypothetical protein
VPKPSDLPAPHYAIPPTKPLTAAQADAILAAAKARSVYATPVYEANGSVHEIAVYASGFLNGTVFADKRGGGLGIWTELKVGRPEDAAEAVRLVLVWSARVDPETGLLRKPVNKGFSKRLSRDKAPPAPFPIAQVGHPTP